MLRRRKISTILGLLIAIGLLSAASATGSAGSTLILDNFVEATETAIADHEPDTAPKKSEWFTEGHGNWLVSGGAAIEASNIGQVGNLDTYALINSKSSNVAAEIDVLLDTSGERQLWGVVARYSSPQDLIFAFYDSGSSGPGQLVLGKKRPDEDYQGNPGTGGFQELGRISESITGISAKLRLEVEGEIIRVFLNEGAEPVITNIDDDNMKSGNVGMFALGDGNVEFDQFIATQLGSGKGGGKGGPKAPKSKGPGSAAPLVEDPPEEEEEDDDDDDKKGKGKGKKGKKK
jgi:hypothetical protein